MFLGAQKSVSVPWWLNAYSRVVLVFKSLPTCPAEPLSAHLGYLAWLTKKSQNHSGLTWGPAHPCGVGLHIWSGHQPFQGGAWELWRPEGEKEEELVGRRRLLVEEQGEEPVAPSPSPGPPCVGLTRLWPGVLGRKREGAFSKPSLGTLWPPSVFWIEWQIGPNMPFAFQVALVLEAKGSRNPSFGTNFVLWEHHCLFV